MTGRAHPPRLVPTVTLLLLAASAGPARAAAPGAAPAPGLAPAPGVTPAPAAPFAPDTTTAAPAGNRAGPALHLEDALRIAMQGNWDLLASRSDVAGAEGALRTARERPNPGVSISTSRIHLDGRGDGTSLGNGVWSRAYDTVVQAGQLVEVGGKRSARKRSAAASLDAADARLEDTRRTLRADVVRAYVSAALAEESARIGRESAGYLQDEARIAEVRWKAGDISQSDLEQIEIAATRLELDAKSAEAEALAQRISLEFLLGAARPAGTVVLADSLDSLASRQGPPPPAPGGERPDLAAARADLRRAENDLRLQRALRVPDPTVLLQFEHEPPDRPNTVGLGLSFPLPLWNRNGGAVAAAEAGREAAERNVKRALAQAASEIAASRAAYDEAAARWRRYRDELQPRSEEIRRSVSLAYEKGGASLLDLLQAQRNDNEVRLATAQAAGDAAIAAAALEAATTYIHLEPVRP